MKAFHIAVLIASIGLMSCDRAAPTDQDFAACRFEMLKRFSLAPKAAWDPGETDKLEFWQSCMQARGHRFDPYLEACTVPRNDRVNSPACYEPMAR